MYDIPFTPNHKITELPPNWIFVFGSNLAGHHSGGAAKDAVDCFGAKWGQGEGLQGQSYAIPTTQGGADAIRPYVDRFIAFAKEHQEYVFVVTPIGCGSARHPLSEIAGLFKEALYLNNVQLPRAFVLAIYAEEALKFGAESHFIDNCLSFPREEFSELDRADIICTDMCHTYTIIKKGERFGLFEYSGSWMQSFDYGDNLQFRSVGPAFGYDEILFYDNRTGYEHQGYCENYDGYVALNEKGHWSVLALDCNLFPVLLCEGNSLEEVADKVVNLTCLRHIRWINPFEEMRLYKEYHKEDYIESDD